MREYGKVYTAFWQDPSIRAMPEDARMLALYLLTCPHANSIGLFRVSDAYAADDMQWSVERVAEGFRNLCETGFIVRENGTGWLAIANYLKWNRFENRNVTIGAMSIFEAAPDGSAKSRCAQGILEFGAHLTDEHRNRLGMVSKPSRNPEPSLAKPEPSQDPLSSAGAPDPVVTIFTHWQTVMNHPQAKLTEERRKKVRRALRDYTAEQCITAINGCAKTPHNMGDNDRGERYDDLELILRDAKHIDRFIRHATNPPKPKVRTQGGVVIPVNPIRDTSKDYSGEQVTEPGTARERIAQLREHARQRQGGST